MSDVCFCWLSQILPNSLNHCSLQNDSVMRAQQPQPHSNLNNNMTDIISTRHFLFHKKKADAGKKWALKLFYEYLKLRDDWIEIKIERNASKKKSQFFCLLSLSWTFIIPHCDEMACENLFRFHEEGKWKMRIRCRKSYYSIHQHRCTKGMKTFFFLMIMCFLTDDSRKKIQNRMHSIGAPSYAMKNTEIHTQNFKGEKWHLYIL